MEHDPPLEHAIAKVAGRQHGYVTRQQLLALALGEKAITYRVRTGRLHRVYPGVYAVGHRPKAPIDRAAAAVLACGPGAVLSHGSAASLWGFFKRWEEPFEVAVALDRRPKAIRVHRCHLARADKTRQLGIPVTTPGRTVLDCACRVHNLARFVNDALLSPSMGATELADTIWRHPRHTGASLVRPIVLGQPGITRSELEDKFVAFCKRFEIKIPELNVVVNGREVDAFFREEGVIIELDSWSFHKDRATFERDRNKDAEAIANGLITVRITDDRITLTAEEEARRLIAILESRRR